MRRFSVPHDYVNPSTRAAVLAQFDGYLKTARGNLVGKTDGEFHAPWTLKAGGKEVFTMPKIAVMRNFVLNHMIHHRGQLSVYLRMLGVKIPSIYGPAATNSSNVRQPRRTRSTQSLLINCSMSSVSSVVGVRRLRIVSCRQPLQRRGGRAW